MRRLITVLALVLASAALAAAATAHEGHVYDGIVVGGTSTPLSPQRNVSYVTGRTGFPGGHVAIQGDRLYLGSYGRGFRIFDISDPAAPRQIGIYEPSRVVADAPPDAAVLDGRHIAVSNGTNRTSRSIPATAGRTDHTDFLDVTDPAHPRLLWRFDGVESPTDGESHNGDIVDSRRLYLPSGLGNVSGVGNGLRIYDLNPLLHEPPAKPAILFRGDPVELWAASPYRRGRDVGPAYVHTHDIEVYTDFEVAGLGKRDVAFIAGGGNYTDDRGDTGSVFVIDITDPRNPVALLRWRHPTGPGHHPIRYFHEIQLLQADPRVALVTDEDLHNGCDAGGVTSIRFSDDLTEATELSEWFIGTGEAPGETPAPVCSVHVFSTHGNLAFFGSYNAGLQVVDYSDPAAPRKVGFHIAPGTTAWGALYHRGYVYVGDMARGLDVFRYGGPRPDLAVTDLRAETGAMSAKISNLGGVRASRVAVRFEDEGALVGERVVDLAPGASTTVSVAWDTKHLKGERRISATVDPLNELEEADETNNTAARTVVVRGNKVRNGDFSASTADGWTGSGSTSYGGGTASAGPGSSWLSDPISVDAWRTYGFSVTAIGGTAVMEQFSALGALLAATPAAGVLAPVVGTTQVRIRLDGGPTGATFNDVTLWEE